MGVRERESFRSIRREKVRETPITGSLPPRFSPVVVKGIKEAGENVARDYF